MPPRLPPLFSLLLAFVAAACAGQAPPEAEQALLPGAVQFAADAAHSPPFARVPYERFTRADAIAIAEQEWRLFGQPINDDPPPPDDAELAPGMTLSALRAFGSGSANTGGWARTPTAPRRRGQRARR